MTAALGNSPAADAALDAEFRDIGWRGTLRRYGSAALLLLLFGAARLPYETHLTRERRAESFNQINLGSVRESIGQLGFVAALSGFRCLVADVLWIQAHTVWERVEYGRMKLLLDAVTTLQPHNVNFWDMASWHMAYNASNYAMEDPRLPTKIRRLKAQREYFMLGKDYAERGIQNNPKAYVLYQSLGAIYRDKLHDNCNAAEAYAHSAACPNAPTFEKRFAAYCLSYCPGHEREAWKELRRLYDLGEQEHLPTLEVRLKAMEQKLDLPENERVYKATFTLDTQFKAIEEKLGIP